MVVILQIASTRLFSTILSVHLRSGGSGPVACGSVDPPSQQVARAVAPNRLGSPSPRPPVPARIRPLEGSPGLVVGSSGGAPAAVIVADVHLGLAAGPDAPLGPPGASAPELAEMALALCGRARARRLVIAGDVKHPIMGVPAWLRPVVFDFFSTLLEAGVVPEVVLGNHDVGLVPYLPREVIVYPSTGSVRNGVGVFHGHRWPGPGVLDQRTIVAGHLHPGYRFAPTADAPVDKRRCWVRVEFDSTRHALHADGRRAKVRQLIVLPAFHPLAGTESLNRERPERGRSFLYLRFLARGATRAYLLDGTDVGALVTSTVRAGRGD